MTHPIDPFAAREALNYDSPIASREAIIEYMKTEGCSVKFGQILKYFSLRKKQQKEALSKRLAAMERDGQILKNRKGEYALVDELALVRGVVIRHKDGLAFVQGELGEAIALSPRSSRTLMVDDTVLVRVGAADYYGRKKGTLIDILSRGHTTVVGRYMQHDGTSYVQLVNNIMQSDLILLSEGGIAAQYGEYVVVAIDRYPETQQQASGRIIEIIGLETHPGFEIDLAIHAYEIPHVWPQAVLDEAAQYNQVIEDSVLADRTDLRHLPFVTIDSETARDFDDAIYVESQPLGGWSLWVAIADVAHYVQEHSTIDVEAHRRGTSVYFPQRVIPMLPEVLSDHLCSLKPKVDRLAVVVHLKFDVKGRVTARSFMRAVIHSHARLTYTAVTDMMEAAVSCPDWFETPLNAAIGLYQQLKSMKQARGAIEFDLLETEIQCDHRGKIKCILPAVRGAAHELIEVFMLAANEAVAYALHQAKEPALFRVHPEPDQEKMKSLKGSLSLMGIKLPKVQSKHYAKFFNQILREAREREDFDRIQTMLLRSLNQAVYQPDNHGHFGLGYRYYTHFTSPIRRYPDILAHRAVCAALIEGQSGQSNLESHWKALGRHCSMLERRADLAVREAFDRLKCQFMQNKMGDVFKGRVVSVTSFGLFVRLNECYIEGLVHVTDLKKDYYIFDEVLSQLVGQRTGYTYSIGSQVTVEVSRVNPERGHIDFLLIS